MTCENNHIHEHTIIDYIQGRKDLYEERMIKKQIENCEDCRKTYEVWAEILENLPSEKPPASLKYRVMEKVNQNAMFSKRFSKPVLAFLSISMATILILTGYIINPSHVKNSEINKQVALNEEQKISQPFMIRDDTNIYEILPERNDQIKGYVWINNKSKEMMLLVDGLHPISLNDYQAWIQTTNELKNAGVIKITGHKGQLYMKDKAINDLEHIVVSKEPVGGSDKPTDPNPVFIKLTNR